MGQNRPTRRMGLFDLPKEVKIQMLDFEVIPAPYQVRGRLIESGMTISVK
jgi:hypothetical protein